LYLSHLTKGRFPERHRLANVVSRKLQTSLAILLADEKFLHGKVPLQIVVVKIF